jgi:hypothetical protein
LQLPEDFRGRAVWGPRVNSGKVISGFDQGSSS